MPQRKTLAKSLTLFINIILISLLLLDSFPTTTGVFVSSGSPDDNSVLQGTTITFNNVNITIRSEERIPFEHLEFKVFDNIGSIATVKFHLDGSIFQQSPSGIFNIQRLFDLSSIDYGYGGSYYGYDEIEGTNHTFNYGYGYSLLSDIYLRYKITYKTHIPGTFYARLFVNANTHVYKSNPSSQFIVLPVDTEPADYYVDINNTEEPWLGTIDNPFNSIQQAVNGAEDGDSILISFGIYEEDIEIKKELVLIGVGDQLPVIQPVLNNYALTIESDNVNVSGFELEGLLLNFVENCHISQCNINNAEIGLHFKYSNNNIIENNNFTSVNKFGLYIEQSSDNTIEDNTFSNKTNSIILLESGNNTIKNSVFTDNIEAISLTKSENNTILNNNLSQNDKGIKLESSDNNEIKENDVFNNEFGIFVSISNKNDIVNNRITSNDQGIYLGSSASNTIENNQIQSNDQRGIDLQYSDSNTILTNFIEDNPVGVYAKSSDQNLIYNNYFNNENNAQDDGTNQWNLNPNIDGTNIIDGPSLGGNYWHDYQGYDIDGDGLGDSNIPYNSGGSIIDGGDIHPLTAVKTNRAPNRPQRPIGPTSGRANMYYTYQSTATDPDGDDLYYQWKWTNYEISDWSGPYQSGDPCETIHKWTQKGAYNIKVRVKDEFGNVSDWSDPLVVSMPKTTDPFSEFRQFIESFLDNFPFLDHIVELILNFLSSLNSMTP